MSNQSLSYSHQVIAALSSMSNCNFGLKFDTEAAAGEHAEKAIKDALTQPCAVKDFINKENAKGDWEIVWGPFTANSKTACKWHTDNTMYIARNDAFDGRDTPLFVVAVAGTNAISAKGWLKEDLNVFKRYKWPTKKAKSGKISRGTQIGLETLENITEDGNSVLAFFEKLDLTTSGNAYEIATCGHSLGGALSPVLALTLKERVIEKKRTNQVTVSTYPSAGATPGNKRFAKYFIDTIKEENYHSVRNNFDMVPHAWENKMLKAIPDLYNNSTFGNIKMSKKIGHLIRDISDILFLKNPFQKYTRIAKDKEFVFDGQPNPDNTDCKDFGAEAVYQHTTAYALYGFQWPDDVREQLLKIQRHTK